MKYICLYAVNLTRVFGTVLAVHGRLYQYKYPFGLKKLFFYSYYINHIQGG